MAPYWTTEEDKMSFRHKQISSGLCVALCMALLGSTSVKAQELDIKVAMAYGMSYLPVIVMAKQQYFEQQLAKEGLGNTKVSYVTFGGGNVSTDALLGGRVSFVASGVTNAITVSSKTNGYVKSVSAIASVPMWLNSRDPAIHTIKDFASDDKIALPGVKVSMQAVVLQMAAAKAFGQSHYNRLDPLTVTMSNPGGTTALLSGVIKNHFSVQPYSYIEANTKGIHTVLNSYDVLGGVHTTTVMYSTTKFLKENPKAYDAFLAAFKQTMAYIHENPENAIRIYLDATHEKMTPKEALNMIDSARIQFSMNPQKFGSFAAFMHRVGSVKTAPKSWRDFFYEDGRSLSGD